MRLRVRMSLIIAISTVSLMACGGPANPGQERAALASKATGDIVVGAAWPWQARQNLLYGHGMDMAVDEVNAKGGINGRRLRIVREDDGETVDQGRVVAQRLAANPEVVAVIGHLESYITNPAAAIYDLAGVLLVAPTATDPELTEQGYHMVFRTTFTDKQIGSEMARVASARGYKRMAIYYIRNRYGRGLANAFEETFNAGGGVVVDRQSYDPNEAANGRPIGALLDDWKTRELQALFIAGEAPQAALVIAEARRKGMNLPVLGGDAMGTPELFASGGKSVDGATIASPFHPDDPRPEVQQFDVAFKKRYGQRPDTAAALAYDSVRILAEGMGKAGSSVPEKVARALHGLNAGPGVTGRFSFAESGDLRSHALVTIVARDGRFAFVSNGTGDRH